jgi:hypothetical protein
MNDALLIEVATVWEMQAETGGDGLNKLQPPARETLRACADLLRMMVAAQPQPAAQVPVARIYLVATGITHEGLTHSGALEYGKSIDGKLANTREIRLVQANAPDLLPSSGLCWLEEEQGSAYAWFCNFGYGAICYFNRGSEGGAVVVRRVDP